MIKILRIIGNVEGVSYLFLLGLVVYKKLMGVDKVYAYGIDVVNKLGWTHGGLLIAYCIILALCMIKFKWTLRFGLYLFIATLIPFGTFVTDRKLKVRQS